MKVSWMGVMLIVQLLEMGLRPATAFGCIINFLVEPLPLVLDAFASEFKALSDKETLKIGIQVLLKGAGGVGRWGGTCPRQKGWSVCLSGTGTRVHADRNEKPMSLLQCVFYPGVQWNHQQGAEIGFTLSLPIAWLAC
jgi:hypothetical protein